MPDEGITILFAEVSNYCFAVEVSQVLTLRRRETVFPVEEGPPELLGLLPMGGAAVPIVDLGLQLGIARTAKERGMLIVAAPDWTPLAFRVDRVDGPVAVPWERLSLLPQLLQELQSRQVVWGVAWRGDTLVPLLDLAQVVPPHEVATLVDFAERSGFV